MRRREVAGAVKNITRPDRHELVLKIYFALKHILLFTWRQGHALVYRLDKALKCIDKI